MDGKLHLLFKEENINGIQSWVVSENKYLIEISMKEGDAIVAEYKTRELWEEMLNHIDKIVY